MSSESAPHPAVVSMSHGLPLLHGLRASVAHPWATRVTYLTLALESDETELGCAIDFLWCA